MKCIQTSKAVNKVVKAVKENKKKAYKIINNNKCNTVRIKAVVDKDSKKVYTESKEVKIKTSEFWKNMFPAEKKKGQSYWYNKQHKEINLREEGL